MKKYITQLLTDLRTAHRPKKRWGENPDESQSIEKHIEEVEAFLSWEEEFVGPTFGEACGINKEVFPPASKLQPKQIKTLSKAIKELLWTWNITLDLPNTLPMEQVYFFQVKVFNMQVMMVNSGMVHMDFCEDDFNLCAFGSAHCSCKKRWEEMEEADQIYDEKVQLFTQDLGIKLASPAAKVKFSTVENQVEVLETKLLPIQTLAEWFDISIEDFPDIFPLWEKRANQISALIMQLWHPEDEMIFILQSLKWDKRFTALKEYMESKVWFDGMDTLYFLPLTEEEKSKYKSPLDNLNLDFDGEGEGDDDLPF